MQVNRLVMQGQTLSSKDGRYAPECTAVPIPYNSIGEVKVNNCPNATDDVHIAIVYEGISE